MKITRKLQKMGDLIHFLFFRRTGEHVENMFFLCPQFTEDQSKFNYGGGDFTRGERRGGDPKEGTQPHLMMWHIPKEGCTSQGSQLALTLPLTPTSTPPHSTHPYITPLHSPFTLVHYPSTSLQSLTTPLY
jgi:hypothetical protein